MACAVLLCALAAPPARADDAPVPLRPLLLQEAGPAHWRGWLDLRELAADRLPGTVRARVDLRGLGSDGVPVRLTLAINGFVINDTRTQAGGAELVSGAIERRFLTTVNRIEITAQAISPGCARSNCPAHGARLADPVVLLDGDTYRPRNFASFIPQFRRGIAVEAENARARTLAAPAISAMGPLAPINGQGPARIIVSTLTPAGAEPWLRLDRGTAEIRDRDGQVLFDKADLASFTIAQVFETARGPLLWVRPGTGPLPGRMDLDQGGIALFDGDRRVIAFSPDFDDAVEIVYPAEVAATPILPLWRAVIIALWLMLSAALLHVWRKTPPLAPLGAAA